MFYQLTRNRVLEALRHRRKRDSTSAQLRPNGDMIREISGQPIELVDEQRHGPWSVLPLHTAQSVGAVRDDPPSAPVRRPQ